MTSLVHRAFVFLQKRFKLAKASPGLASTAAAFRSLDVCAAFSFAGSAPQMHDKPLELSADIRMNKILVICQDAAKQVKANVHLDIFFPVRAHKHIFAERCA